MEAIFTFVPKDEFNINNVVEELTSQGDFKRYLKLSTGKSVTVHLKLSEKLSEKQKMYNYYHKVILSVAMRVFSNDGWEAVDKVFADHLLKCECGRGMKYNAKTNKEEVYLLDKSRMNMQELHKFISDCITFLEVEKGAIVPDSASFLAEVQTGIKGFKVVESKKR